MFDIRLITILPSAPGIQQPSTAFGLSNQTTPTILTNLPAGSILSGFIINRDAKGNPILRTESGDIVFETNFFLKIGSEVVIRIEGRLGHSQARIISVNGQAPEVAEAKSSFMEDPDIVGDKNARPAATSQPSYSSARGAAPLEPIINRAAEVITITGTLLKPSVDPGIQSPLPAGTQLTFKIITLNAPPSEAPAPVLPTTSQPQVPSIPGSIPATAASQPIPATPPLPTTTPTPAALPFSVIPATVIGNEPTSEAIVQTPLGIIRLQPGTALPVGSTLSLEIIKTVLPSGTTVTDDAALPTPLTDLAYKWNSLQQIFSLLQERFSGDETLAIGLPGLLAAGTNTAPTAVSPQAISAGLMFFVAALRGGDFRNWLGRDNASWLEEHGHAKLLAKAEGEFTTISRTFNELQPWQTLFFPFALAGEVHQVRMFVKRERKHKEGQKKSDDTRFVVEVELSQMGEIQMDGFVKRHDKDIAFDLMIRTLQPMLPDVQREILQIYNHMAELTGYKGQIVFHTVKEFPIHPLEEVVADGHNTVVV